MKIKKGHQIKMPGKKFEIQAVDDEILAKFSLKNRYSFLNNNLMAILSKDEFNFLKEVQRFCVRFEKKNEITHGPEEDIYNWIPAFGEKGYITRQHTFDVCDVHYEEWGLSMDLMRNLPNSVAKMMFQKTLILRCNLYWIFISNPMM